MKPIYEPKGAAKEYCDYALNIYTGCPHGCFYCYVPNVLHCDRSTFHSNIEPRKNIIEETRKQLEKDEMIRGKLIHLCFTCDPYPTGYDTTPTREIIKLLKEYGNHIQILTKGNGARDVDLLDSDDWYGITIDGGDLTTNEVRRMQTLEEIHKRGIKIWISFEPVVNAANVMKYIRRCAFVDKIKIGKLNYHKSDINWADFGRQAEALCQEFGIDYYIKDSLRKEMQKYDDIGGDFLKETKITRKRYK